MSDGTTGYCVETAIASLFESAAALLSLSEEYVPQRLLRLYKKEMYEALMLARWCCMRRRELYSNMTPGSDTATVSRAADVDFERMTRVAKQLAFDLYGDSGMPRPGRRRKRHPDRGSRRLICGRRLIRP